MKMKKILSIPARQTPPLDLFRLKSPIKRFSIKYGTHIFECASEVNRENLLSILKSILPLRGAVVHRIPTETGSSFILIYKTMALGTKILMEVPFEIQENLRIQEAANGRTKVHNDFESFISNISGYRLFLVGSEYINEHFLSIMAQSDPSQRLLLIAIENNMKSIWAAYAIDRGELLEDLLGSLKAKIGTMQDNYIILCPFARYPNQPKGMYSGYMCFREQHDFVMLQEKSDHLKVIGARSLPKDLMAMKIDSSNCFFGYIHKVEDCLSILPLLI